MIPPNWMHEQTEYTDRERENEREDGGTEGKRGNQDTEIRAISSIAGSTEEI